MPLDHKPQKKATRIANSENHRQSEIISCIFSSLIEVLGYSAGIGKEDPIKEEEGHNDKVEDDADNRSFTLGGHVKVSLVPNAKTY